MWSLCVSDQHGRVAKGKCPGILESLATSGDLIMKEYGKAKVFLAKQVAKIAHTHTQQYC